MSKYETACEFLDKADYEGGLPDMVLGYGVSEQGVPPGVYVAMLAMLRAYEGLKAAVTTWHQATCMGWVDYGDGPEPCRWTDEQPS